MRLLDKSRKPPTMIELGLSEAMRADLESIVSLPTGALLVTGPTGSGKSTTLYGCLAQINRPEINIITVEDPVEYRLAGVNQVQINVRAGLTFASSLRSILRSDPDVVMVGEIRDVDRQDLDRGRAHGALRPLDLHTNDAQTIRGSGRWASSLLTGCGIRGPRAAPRPQLCTHCCEAYQPTAAELRACSVDGGSTRSIWAGSIARRGVPVQPRWLPRGVRLSVPPRIEDPACEPRRHRTSCRRERHALDVGRRAPRSPRPHVDRRAAASLS
jgi:type IV pilus assembly protein PilB